MARRMLGMSTPVRAALRERAVSAPAPGGFLPLPDVTTWAFSAVRTFEIKALVGLVYNDDGSKMYVVSNQDVNNSRILHNTPDLSPPYVPVDDTTPLSIAFEGSRTREIGWSSDGLKAFGAGFAAAVIIEYTNSGTAYNPGSAELTAGTTFNCTGTPISLFARDNGAEIYYVNNDNGNLYQIVLSTPDLLSSASMGDTYNPSEVAVPVGLVFGGSGETLYILGLDAVIYEYSLSVAWDITSATYTTRSKDISGDMPVGTTAWGLAVSPDSTKLITALAHSTASSNKIMYFTR